MPIWKRHAVADRRHIAKHIAQGNPAAAVELVDALLAKAGLLDANPKLGRIGRMKGTRKAVAHPNYVLVYEVSADTVTVLRVLHTSQAWPAQGDGAPNKHSNHDAHEDGAGGFI